MKFRSKTKEEAESIRNMYGCNTKQPGYRGVQDTFLVQDGYEEIGFCGISDDGRLKNEVVMSRRPRYVYMRNRNNKECRYDRWQADAKCAGCEAEKAFS